MTCFTCYNAQRVSQRYAACPHCGNRMLRQSKRCAACHNSSTASTTCPECEGPKSYSATRCRPCWNAQRKRPTPDPDGYVFVWVDDPSGAQVVAGWPGTPPRPRRVRKREHVWVMEQHLGRALLPEESVHHINGVRHDNRLENLELWSSSHPAGQRVSDKVAWAREILALYEVVRE